MEKKAIAKSCRVRRYQCWMSLISIFFNQKETTPLSRGGFFLLPLTAFFHLHLLPTGRARKKRPKRTPKYIHPPLSVVIRLQPKGGLSACVRFDQKCKTKNPDLLSQIRINLVEVTGFEPATFWSRILVSLMHFMHVSWYGLNKSGVGFILLYGLTNR